MSNNKGTLGRVYGGDPTKVHVKDGTRIKQGMWAADSIANQMRLSASQNGDPRAFAKPLCPGCYMVVAFDALVHLAKENNQSLTELARTMAAAFAELERDPANPFREEIRVLLDPEEAVCPT